MFRVHLCHGFEDALREGVGVFGGAAFGGDGFAGDEEKRPRSQMVDVHWQELIGADEGEWDDGHAGADRHPGGAGEEGLDVALGGASAVGKEEQRHTRLQRGHAEVQAGDGGTDIRGVDRYLAGAVEMPADEWNLPEIVARQNAELKGKSAEEHRRIHVAEVVAGEDCGWMPEYRQLQIIWSNNFHRRQPNRQHHPRPGLGHPVLLTT